MKKNDLSKLTLFLSGVKNRLTENALYFIDARITFRSGSKTYNASLTPEGDRFLFTCNAQKRTLDAAGFIKAFLDEAQKYDACILEYRERGSTLIIEADERGVRTRQNAAKSEPVGEDAHDAADDRNPAYELNDAHGDPGGVGKENASERDRRDAREDERKLAWFFVLHDVLRTTW